jgi:transposase-like protein
MKDRTPKPANVKIEVLQLLRDAKHSPQEIADRFDMDPATVYRWAKAAGIVVRRGALDASAPGPMPVKRARAPMLASAPEPANDARVRELESDCDVLARALAILVRRQVRFAR